MSKYLVIVESPTKAKTISRFLSKEYEVVSSVGHVRDLPRSATDIPKKYKEFSWARLGIDVENDFLPLYVPISGKTKTIREIKQQLKNCEELILATDEDREGESIAWHIVEMLNPKVPLYRMVFHEITKTAIQKALETYRKIDMDLVRAQETRRIIDRLFGYRLSELIWKKITYRLSAGRVQSPSLRLLVERERLRAIFKTALYYDLNAELSHNKESVPTKLSKIGEKKIAIGADFDIEGNLTRDVVHLSKKDCTDIQGSLSGSSMTIQSIEKKVQNIHPPIPYTTSSMQQDANRKLKLTSRDTMRTAQSLYEQGYITYMRTDSPNLSTQAVKAARESILQKFDASYVHSKPRMYFKKSKNAQEAHEAIRPAGDNFKDPDKVPLQGRELALYKLIWKRTLASQMTAAIKDIQTITFTVGKYTFSSTGSVITFQGFLALSQEKLTGDVLFPEGLHEGLSLPIQSTEVVEHKTKPPARYNDASLVKHLEQLSIGRPSTYATIINTLLDRKYAKRMDQALVPTLTGFSVNQFLEDNFSEYIDYDFTADLENSLDKIAVGEENYLHYLKSFYLGEEGLANKVEKGQEIDKEKSQLIRIPQLKSDYEIRVGRYGAYITRQDTEENKENISIPEDCNPSDISPDYILELMEIKRKSLEPIGVDDSTGKNVYCLTGKYGPYVQLGEVTEEEPKPRRAQIPKTIPSGSISLAEALKLLSIPKVMGVHPKTNEEISVHLGRFGPYIKCGEKTRTLTKNDDIYTITFERTLERLEEEVQRRKPRSSLLKDLGAYSSKKVPIKIFDGPFGPYIKIGTRKNVSLPDDKKDPESIKKLTLQDVEGLIKKAL